MSRKVLFYLFVVISLVLTICLELFMFNFFVMDKVILLVCSVAFFACFLFLLTCIFSIIVTKYKKYWATVLMGGLCSLLLVISVLVLLFDTKCDLYRGVFAWIAIISLTGSFVFLMMSSGMERKVREIKADELECKQYGKEDNIH